MKNKKLKDKTIKGISWSLIDTLSNQGILFIVGIVLARLLGPEAFGLLALIIVFISISKVFVTSGFNSALIRKPNCNDSDYSTVLYSNIGVAVLFYLLIFISAPLASSFYNEPQLTILLRVIGLVIIINSFSIVQRAILTKKLNFRLQTKISIISSVLSGIVGILLAVYGFGVWSLIFKTLLNELIFTILLWAWNDWIPKSRFSYSAFKQLFSYSYKLLLGALLNAIYKEINSIIIGKYFGATSLGFYTRSVQFQRLPSQNINNVLQKVSFPVLSEVQGNAIELKIVFKKFLMTFMFLSFILLMGLAAIAEPLIMSLLGEEWSQSIVYLQILCFMGMFNPIHVLNLNLLKVKGRSDLSLKLEIIKKIINIPGIVLGIYYGIIALLLFMVFSSFAMIFLNAMYTKRIIGYSSFSQIYDILPFFIISLGMASIIYLFNTYANIGYTYMLVSDFVIGFVFIILIGEFLKVFEYLEIKTLIIKTLNRKR